MDKVFRCFVEKRPGFDAEARALFDDFTHFLGLRSLLFLRLFHRYDIEGADEAAYRTALVTVLSEPICDDVYGETLPPLPDGARLLMIESLPGQYDQRADSCAQCVQMITGGERPEVRVSKVLAVGDLNEEEFARLSAYVINPVESGPASPAKPETLKRHYDPPAPVPVLDGFLTGADDGLRAVRETYGLAMDMADLRFFQDYFRKEGRDPTLTELKVVDTYWSDHCRHTTFHTHLTGIGIDDPRAARAYDAYLEARRELYGPAADSRPVTLMDIATCGMKWLHAQGRMPGLDVSDEINACTVRVRAEVDGAAEDWLLLFKNETHNHPTEIEPFGGAATCIGGAIRDPLSGRAYVYQAMRVTGSGDPRAGIDDTCPGKLPQRKLTVTAAAGYSSYGNQIGLATGLVREHYHPGFIAKRMEIGAVVGAAPASAVVRETPAPGDVIILLGGRTGRDGIGGATGSSKSHDARSVQTCAAEVQKGNPPEERKLQRLFRDPAVTRLIRRCNDFGAGGVSVAIGELADGLEIDLDLVPKKYEGLDGTELAISESQERMAVVTAPGDAGALCRAAQRENLEATVVARVTAAPRLVMRWNGQTVVDISRAFLNSNGAAKSAAASVADRRQGTDREGKLSNPPARPAPQLSTDLASRLLLLASDLNFCSQKGLMERFDSSIGAGSVLVPHGGRHRLSPTQVMAALLPVIRGTTEDCSVMSCAYDPELAVRDPFGAARWAVVESVARLLAAGCSYGESYLTLQEYFPRPREDPARWGLPLAALLGAFDAQMGLGVAAIGGKDSMSGSFLELDVPPTLVSFAVTMAKAGQIISPEWKGPGHGVYLLSARGGKAQPHAIVGRGDPGAPPSAIREDMDYETLKTHWDAFRILCREGKVLSAMTAGDGGAAGAVMLMSLGNMIGFKAGVLPKDFDWFDKTAGSIVFESDGDLEAPGAILLGRTEDTGRLVFDHTVLPLASLRAAWEKPLESVFPADSDRWSAVSGDTDVVPALNFTASTPKKSLSAVPCPLSTHTARPRVVIPVFPGTNCEYDSVRAMERAGAEATVLIIRNLTPALLAQSAGAMERELSRAQMLFIPGGFSAGDEPDGSGKFIAAFFRHPRLTEAARELLRRDGLILGVCNGFQALIKLGLVPHGDILPPEELDATLTFNTGGYRSRYITTRVSSVLSPWLSRCEAGQLHVIPVAHGEGRFMAAPERLETLAQKGQIAFQYCDADGQPSLSARVNPNGSLWAVEGITSPDGRVLGKMGHTERYGPYVARNIPGEKFQPLFEGGVAYFG